MSPTESRTGRRERTIDTILERALEIMAEVGVGGLTMTALARSMSIQPPSLYKYFPSVLAVYDLVFARGQLANLEALDRGIATAPHGLAALRAGMTETARWAVEHPVTAQLLFWRPVPGFTPSDEAMAPAGLLVGRLITELGHAVERSELDPSATSEEALTVLASLHFGVLSQHLANEPDRDWSTSRYTQAYDRVIDLFVAGYAPAPG